MTHSAGFVSKQTNALIEHPSDHAGESETSRMMYLRPDLVHSERFDAFAVQAPTLEGLRSKGVSFVRPWHAYLSASAGGETRSPRQANTTSPTR